MERTILSRLVEWARSPDRQPLVLNGARQVGKTWLLNELGRVAFENIAYVNLDNNRFMIDRFEEGYDLRRLLAAIQAQTRQPIVPGKTFIILDEIQECPKALTSLKYFSEQMPEMAIGCAGSLLGLASHEGTGYPVGRVKSLDVYPLSYREFLDAVGLSLMREIIDAGDLETLSALSSEFVAQLRNYLYVGGMPKAVANFAKTQDYVSTREIQEEILRGYSRDVSKHVPVTQLESTLAAWGSIPTHLSRENRRFVFGHVREGARGKAFQYGLLWLEQAGVAVRARRVSKPAIPLAGYADTNAFKLFLVDVGLLGAMAELDVRTALDGSAIFEEFKGALTEQYACQQLLSECGLRPFYWKAENARAEVDFVVQSASKVYGVEVKAGENLRSQSLRAFHDKFPHTKAIRFSLSGWREQSWMTNVPLYAMSNMRLWEPEEAPGRAR